MGARALRNITPPPSRPPSAAESAGYIRDLTKSMADLAQTHGLAMLSFFLGMAALEAGEAQIRLSGPTASERDSPIGPDAEE